MSETSRKQVPFIIYFIAAINIHSPHFILSFMNRTCRLVPKSSVDIQLGRDVVHVKVVSYLKYVVIRQNMTREFVLCGQGRSLSGRDHTHQGSNGIGQKDGRIKMKKSLLLTHIHYRTFGSQSQPWCSSPGAG